MTNATKRNGYKLYVLRKRPHAVLAPCPTHGYRIEHNVGGYSLLGVGASPYAAWRDAWLRLTTPKEDTPSGNEGYVSLYVRVPKSVHSRVTAEAVKGGVGITGWCLAAIEHELARQSK